MKETTETTETLIITKVDLELLESQRVTLGSALCGYNKADGSLLLNVDETFALSGIVNMLDAWSDERCGQ
ncbi:MAG: hypothetical protein WC343_06100 [Bacilli bacterium]|jgi:hypothetical protein